MTLGVRLVSVVADDLQHAGQAAFVRGLLLGRIVKPGPRRVAPPGFGAITIYLVRHGRTAFNAAGVLRGHADVPLDEVGRSEAERLGAMFSAVPLALVVTSPLARAYGTAEPIARSSGLALEVDERLVDRDYGPFTGMPPEDAGLGAGQLTTPPRGRDSRLGDRECSARRSARSPPASPGRPRRQQQWWHTTSSTGSSWPPWCPSLAVPKVSLSGQGAGTSLSTAPADGVRSWLMNCPEQGRSTHDG